MHRVTQLIKGDAPLDPGSLCWSAHNGKVGARSPRASLENQTGAGEDEDGTTPA